MLSQTRNTGPVMTSRRQTNCCAAVNVGEPENKHGEMKIASVSRKKSVSLLFGGRRAWCHNKGTTDGWAEGRKEAELSDSTRLDGTVWCVAGLRPGVVKAAIPLHVHWRRSVETNTVVNKT